MRPQLRLFAIVSLLHLSRYVDDFCAKHQTMPRVVGAHAMHERRVIDGKDICDVLDDFVERAGAVVKALGAALRDMKLQYKLLCQFMSFDASESAETFEIFEIMQRFSAEVVKQHKISAAEAAAAAEKTRKENAAALQKLAARARASSRIERSQSFVQNSDDVPSSRDAVDAPSSLTSLDLARAIPPNLPILFRKKVVRRESFSVAPCVVALLPTFQSVDDICMAFHPHSLVARMAAATVECIPLSKRGITVIPSQPKHSQLRQSNSKTRSPTSAFVGPSPSTRINGRRSSVRPVDLATQRATVQGMKGKKVHSALRGQLLQDIVGSVLTEIKLKRGSTSYMNKASTICHIQICRNPSIYFDIPVQVETQEKSLLLRMREDPSLFRGPCKAEVQIDSPYLKSIQVHSQLNFLVCIMPIHIHLSGGSSKRI